MSATGQRRLLRRLGYPNVTFETMNVAARMVDGFNLGGCSRWRRHRVHLRRGTIVNRRQLCDRRDAASKTGVRLLLLEPDASQLSVDDGVPAATVPYSAQRFYAWPESVSMSATAPTSSVVGDPAGRRRASQ